MDSPMTWSINAYIYYHSVCKFQYRSYPRYIFTSVLFFTSICSIINYTILYEQVILIHSVNELFHRFKSSSCILSRVIWKCEWKSIFTFPSLLTALLYLLCYSQVLKRFKSKWRVKNISNVFDKVANVFNTFIWFFSSSPAKNRM